MISRQDFAYLDAIYAMCEDDDAFAHISSTVAQFCGTRSAMVHSIEPQTGQQFYSSCYFNPLDFQRYIDEFHDSDPWRDAMIANDCRGRVAAMDRYLPPEAFRQTVMFNELFKVVGDDTCRALTYLTRPGGAQLAIGAHRAEADKAFDDNDVQRLEWLHPHIARVLRLRELLDAERARTARLQDLADASQRAVLSVTSDLKVKSLTAAARRILDERDGLAVANGSLRLSQRALRQSIQAAVAQIMRRENAGQSAFACPRPSGRRAYHLTILPASLEPSVWALILIDDPHPKNVSEVQAMHMQQIYGLSGKELNLVRSLMADKSLADIAGQRQVAKETVRSQLRSLFLKTGTTRQSALVRLFARFL